MLIWSSMAHLSPHHFFSPYLFSLHRNIVSIIFNLQQHPHPVNLTIHSIIFRPQTNQPSNFFFFFSFCLARGSVPILPLLDHHLSFLPHPVLNSGHALSVLFSTNPLAGLTAT